MPSSEKEAGSPEISQENEPRLKYEPLDSGNPRPQSLRSPIARLCVSDKVLAVGHRDGSLQLLDHLGNQVKEFREHSREVTDLSFDDGAEFLASSSADGTIAIYGLYSDEVQRLKVGQPVTTVALEPRYANRKTRELVYGTAGGALVLSSKGWLGNKETALFTGKGPLRCARMSGTLLAWTTDSGLRVYDTATHTRLGKLERPASAVADPAAPCALLWRGDRELCVSWGSHITVVRVTGSLLPLGQLGLLPAAAGRSLQVVASFDTGCTALGAAPFGADIAVLAWGSASDASSTDSLPVSSGTDGRRIIVTASSTAEAQAGPANGQAEAAVASPNVDGGESTADSAVAIGNAAAEASAAAADGSSTAHAGAQQQSQQQPPPQLQQQLSLCFYSRQGQLLASDALGTGCSAAERRWHQLALSYSGNADLQLASVASAAASIPHRSSLPLASPARSIAGSRASSLAGSGRGTPSKPLRSHSDAAASPAAASVASNSADGAAEAAEGQQAGADGNATEQPQQQPEQHQEQQGQASDGQQQQQQQQPPVRQYKWWRDGEEPLYFVCTPSEIVVGRPRDGNDRVSWLAQRGRFAEALAVADEDRSVQLAVREALAEQYLEALIEAGRYQEAAALCPTLLQGNAMAWERWAFTFAQVRGLSALAPLLPTDSPRLKAATYDLVLSSFLLHPADHAVLLQLVRRWPPDIYDVQQLQGAILSRMGGGSGWPVLQEVASHLYTVQGRHEEALKLMLQLRSLAVFEYIARHALIDRISPFAAALVDLDEVRATSLLVEHCEEVPPREVVAALQDAFAAARSADERQRWRRRLHHYLDWLFQKDSQLGGAFAELQVELYAEFEAARLLHFLMVSPSYPLERAYQVCEQRGLVREMVYVLGRMGSAEKALRLIIEGLRDMVQAVEFVQLQRDDDMWEQLIALTLGDAQLTGALLDHAGGYIDPLRVVSQIPPHLRVDNLRGRLVKIITDFRTQMSLQQGCNTILRHDCVVLANRLYRVLRSSLRRLHLKQHGGGGGSGWVLYDTRTGEETAEDDAAAALLAGSQGLAATASGSASASPEQGTPPSSYAAAVASGGGGGASGGGGGASSAQSAQQQAAPQVWVGFLGGGSPAQPEARLQQQQQPQQLANRSPSKFVRLASSSPSPARSGGGAGPRKVLAT